jgi:small multidrug resistance pump
MAWFYLGLAVVVEVISTTALKFSEGFSRPFPTAIVVIGYGLAFFLLARIVQLLPLSVTYAVWSGAGVALATLVGWIFLGRKLDLAALLGIALSVAGVVVIQFFSGSLNV